MANQSTHNARSQSDKVETDNVKENVGNRAAAINADPSIALEEARNAAEGKSPNAAGGVASSTAEEAVPGTSDPEASNLPSSNTPTPD